MNDWQRGNGNGAKGMKTHWVGFAAQLSCRKVQKRREEGSRRLPGKSVAKRLHVEGIIIKG